MYQLISNSAEAIAEELQELGDLGEYVTLLEEYSSGDLSDPAFQGRYRRYWRMNVARLSPEFYSRYFHLMAECRAGRAPVLRDIAVDLSRRERGGHGLQFSFATKLVHTVDPRLPVYDSFVAGFYFYSPPPSNRPRPERLKGLLEFYEFLRREYARVIERGLLGPAIAAIRKRWQLPATIPNERIIDWAIWGWVSHLRGGAQWRGESLYS